MQRHLALLALAVLLTCPLSARAAEPTPAPTPTPATMSAPESAFVTQVQADLTKRFPTAKDAEKAGYIRYTNEDDTGAISYANKKWVSTSPQTPSQLWYDVNGRLLGADYSVLRADHPTAPSILGISPSRFGKVNAHVHYVLKNADGTFTYGRLIHATKYAAAGLDAEHPTAAGLVKIGAVTSADQVATVFLLPAIWDVTVWTIPNPDGAFADKNPNVKPAHMPKSMDMHEETSEPHQTTTSANPHGRESF